MKEPSSSSLCRFRKKPAATKLKLVCSFNGAFHVRPPSNKLRYIGGETRIVSVDRTISFSKLRSKISDICPNAASFSIKYHLPLNHNITNNPDDDGNPLVLVASDDDVRCMVEEYDKFELYGKHARIRVYLCSECEGNKDDDDSHSNGIVKENNDHDSLRKKILKQQLLAQQNKKYEKPLIDLDLGPNPNVSVIKNDPFRVNVFNATGNGRLRPLNPRNGNVVSVAVGQNASVKWPTRQSGEGGWCNRGSNITENSGQSLLPLKGAYNCGTVLKCDSLDGKQDVRNMGPMTICNFNRENIMPWAMSRGSMQNQVGQPSCSDQRVGSVKSSHVDNRDWGDCQNGILSHGFGVNHTRDQRNYLRNQRNNLVEMGSHRGVRLNGKILVGKCYIGTRPNSGIAKHLGSYNPYTLNPWADYSESTLEGGVNMPGSFSNEGCSSFEVQQNPEKFREQGGPAILQYGNSNLEESHLAYQVTCHGVGDQSSASCNRTPSSFVGVMNTWEDLLPGSNVEKQEVRCSTLHENFHEIPMNCEPIHCCLENEKFLVDSQKNGNISDLSNDRDCRNGTSLGCNMENGTKNLQDRVASSMDLLYNLSLSSAKEMDPLHNSSFASNDLSDLLLKQESKPLDCMDEGKFMIAPTVNESKKVASKSSFHNAATGRIDVHKEEIQLDPPSDLSLKNKVITKKSHLSPKVIGGISCTLTEFCTHVATGELQTIKASDLEYIKELGSGTFGTVFYGKWKGSDVAIKRMKPSCFTEGSLEEDRMVADFWREALMLAQLHHPNVVAFYGVVSEGPVMNLATVTEYMVNGSLKQVLRRKDRTIDRRKRLIIAMDAAFGMEYLHEKKIVHFDLKSHNLLVNMRDPQRPVCKIGDLGLSKVKQKTLISGGVRGTLPWMAPELLNSKNNLVTEKIDVYSFGIVMWELLTGEEPYADLHSKEIIAGIIKGSLRPGIPSWCDPSWRSLMERCWSSDPNSRPAFSEIAKELRAMAAAMNIK